MKNKALTFVIGLFVGTILATIGFVIYNNIENKNLDKNAVFEVRKKEVQDIQDNTGIKNLDDKDKTIVNMQDKTETDNIDEENENTNKKKSNIVNMQDK